MEIREATEADIPAMLALWRTLEAEQGPHRIFPIAPDPEARITPVFREAIADAGTKVLIAEHDGDAIGMALVAITPGRGLHDVVLAEISRVVVRPDHRGRKVGAALLEAAEGFGRERGAHYLSAKMFSGNHRGRAFWERMGFVARYEERVRPIIDAEDA